MPMGLFELFLTLEVPISELNCCTRGMSSSENVTLCLKWETCNGFSCTSDGIYWKCGKHAIVHHITMAHEGLYRRR